jgi:hypothetical protein
VSASGPGRVKTRPRGHDVKYSSRQEPKRAIKQRHTSQSPALLEYYSSIAGQEGVFTRPRSSAFKLAREPSMTRLRSRSRATSQPSFPSSSALISTMNTMSQLACSRCGSSSPGEGKGARRSRRGSTFSPARACATARGRDWILGGKASGRRWRCDLPSKGASLNLVLAVDIIDQSKMTDLPCGRLHAYRCER